jgi:pseudaminic acid cytidylyltransferase
MNIAVIIARGGSKRIPRKNIKDFCGQPMIAYPIRVARETTLFHRIIVSTDDDEIAEIAEDYGAETPFMRPDELAGDCTTTAEALIHSLQWLEDHGEPADYFCCIYPTTPFLKGEDLKKGFELLRREKGITAFSVTTFGAPIFRAFKIGDDGHLQMFWPEYRDTRSQDLPNAYHDAGQFYWGDTKRFLREKVLYTKESVPVILPRYLVHDIDTVEDWETAEKLYLALS